MELRDKLLPLEFPENSKGKNEVLVWLAFFIVFSSSFLHLNDADEFQF